jgi:hypothetical protein
MPISAGYLIGMIESGIPVLSYIESQTEEGDLGDVIAFSTGDGAEASNSPTSRQFNGKR